MKKQSENLFETMISEQQQSIKSQVNETLATFFTHTNSKTFSVAELWNIQRKGKSIMQRRHSF
jgi:hypothetical protein